MKQNELTKYEFDLLAGTEQMVIMISNRLSVTTDTPDDFETVYEALDSTAQDGLFFINNITDSGIGVNHVYFTNNNDRTRFVDAIQQI